MMDQENEQRAVDDDHDGEPLPMQFLSTWEVRKVPANCVSRLCTVRITAMEILKEMEPGLQSVILSVSMKTPHRSLRSNELKVPESGTMAIPLNLTFSLQYPHFIKCGGNALHIRLQRRKRYRNRPIRGYKTLAWGEINMALVLQRSFQGAVKLYSQKTPDEVLVVVTVGSITSIPTEFDVREHGGEGSSEDEDDELIFSDELAERGSDTDSMENMDTNHPHVPKISLKPSSVLRLLRLRGRGGSGRRSVPVEVTLGIDEEGEGAESAISSLSDSYEEEEEYRNEMEGQAHSTPRPRLRPFFGPDNVSLLSLPRPLEGAAMEGKEGEGDDDNDDDDLMFMSGVRSSNQGQRLEVMDLPESTVVKGQLWLLLDSHSDCELLQTLLKSQGEPAVAVTTVSLVSKLVSLLATLRKLWHGQPPFQLLLAGGDELLASMLQAYVRVTNCYVVFALWPTGSMISARYGPALHRSLADVQEHSIATFLESLATRSTCQHLPIGQVEMHLISVQEGSLEPHVGTKCIPFICNLTLGSWEAESDPQPTSPSTPSSEHSEIVLEYWSAKKDSQKSTVKARSVMVTLVAGPILNVTAITRKKGIRIRRAKDSTGEGAIMSLTASQLTCRVLGKQETVPAHVDGVEWPGVNSIRLTAQWERSHVTTLPLLIRNSPFSKGNTV